MDSTILVIMFMSATQTFDLPKGLLSSVCYVESKHKVNAIHKDDGNGNSLGVCQIKLSTAKLLGFRGNEKQLMNPKINIHYAAKYLKKQLTRYDGDVRKAISAYNAGTFRENKQGLTMNRKYVKKVFSAWASNQ